MYTRSAAVAMSTVYAVELPSTVGGLTAATADGFIIAINSTLPAERQRFALEHELAHIRLGHYTNGCEADLQDMEREADELARLTIDQRGDFDDDSQNLLEGRDDLPAVCG